MKSRCFVILPINLILLALALADLASTLVWISCGAAIEVNPIMAAVLHSGVWAFAGVKLFTIAAYLLTMEWYRRSRSESFAKCVGLITVLAYTGIYAVSFTAVNYNFLLN